MDFGFDPFESTNAEAVEEQDLHTSIDPSLNEDEARVDPHRDAVLWVVDCWGIGQLNSESGNGYHGPPSLGYFADVLKTLEGFLKNKIITSEARDLVALVLLGVEDLDPPVKVKPETGEKVPLNQIGAVDSSIFAVLLPLAPPDANNIQMISTLGWGNFFFSKKNSFYEL